MKVNRVENSNKVENNMGEFYVVEDDSPNNNENNNVDVVVDSENTKLYSDYTWLKEDNDRLMSVIRELENSNLKLKNQLSELQTRQENILKYTTGVIAKQKFKINQLEDVNTELKIRLLKLIKVLRRVSNNFEETFEWIKKEMNNFKGFEIEDNSGESN